MCFLLMRYNRPGYNMYINGTMVGLNKILPTIKSLPNISPRNYKKLLS